ncbi:MAG: ribosomal RNA small subunit methyltransferase A [Planctomycetales bacterium]|nr:ribosomal RNA small subunit methyltransferase A [Planctomycetales bacterium]
MAQRQTLSFLTQRFREVGIRPLTKFGQNFLIDLNLVELLAKTADVGERDVVLEVGTGTGSLTAMLAEHAAHVVTVEVDPQLYQLAEEELAERDNVTMLQQDALRNKNNIHPVVLEEIAKQMAVDPCRQLKLAANLPYNIATPLISNLLLTEITPVLMAVTIQKELADRIVAKPGTKDYGALSVWVQSLCRAEVVRDMPPTVFWPRPKVDSSIIRIEPRDELRQRIPDLRYYHCFVRSMFFHRRKFLRSVVVSAFKGRLDKEAVDQVLAEHGISAESRAEQLTPDQLLAMCESFRARAPQWS